ncbi:sugar phosphate nucleotidyltransferase [Salimicrobium sp. PL1-032A]|uniref:sugar phosphate nucleotidyltransferase n=1 Tax=Salimicrobium sp. PL1-032A TaxID=3095364 RepID=UPI00326156F7
MVQNMKLMLMSGGSGKRLWPLSNDSRSKQFLKLLPDGNNGRMSMLQRVFRQLQDTPFGNDSFIITNFMQNDLIKSQLGSDVPTILEPSRRDTYPAIALACSYLYSVEGCTEDTWVGVTPCDSFTSTSFFQKLETLAETCEQENANLGLLGLVPSHPTDKYGYIVPKKVNQVTWVDHFVEKPEPEKAKTLINQGAYWNGGVFVFRLSYLLDHLRQHNYPTDYFELRDSYELLPKTSFDYAMVEQEDSMVVEEYDGFWKDLGTWNTLTEESGPQVVGRGTLSDDCSNTHIFNELDLPVFVHGIRDAIVAIGADGILVSDKEKSAEIKSLLEDTSPRPMYEERRWGRQHILDFQKTEDEQEVLTSKLWIDEGKNLSYHSHRFRTEIWTIVQGSGWVARNEIISKVNPGDVITIPPEDKHALKAETAMELIEVQLGTSTASTDIETHFHTWGEIRERCIVRQTPPRS